MHVTDLMDVNAGDEQHLAENWQECATCGCDYPADYNACAWGCDDGQEGR